MTIIAQDPAVRRDDKIVMSTIDVPAEDLRVGPMGYRVQVADYDATCRIFHGSHALPASIEKEPKAWQNGDPSIPRDFTFHAQNAYALVMKTLARFEFGPGRAIRGRYPGSGGYAVTSGATVKVECSADLAVGGGNKIETWGPHTIADGAIIDVTFTM
jgi:hypothetical protein